MFKIKYERLCSKSSKNRDYSGSTQNRNVISVRTSDVIAQVPVPNLMAICWVIVIIIFYYY